MSKSELYMELFKKVEKTILKHENGDAAMGYITLKLNKLPNEQAQIAMLKDTLKMNKSIELSSNLNKKASEMAENAEKLNENKD